MEKNYKMIMDYLENNKVFRTEEITDKNTIIEELGYTLKESKEYSVVYSKNGLYNIVAYNYIKVANKDVTIRRTFELDLL